MAQQITMADLLQITCGEAYDFTSSFPRKTAKKEIARQLISKLPVKGEKYRTDEQVTQYNKFINTVSTRISGLVDKVQKHHAFERNHISRTDILIDIEVDCPAIAPTDSQTLSQESYASTTSTMSSSQNKVLEFLDVEPQPQPQTRHRKAFDDLGNERKRQKTDPIYDLAELYNSVNIFFSTYLYPLHSHSAVILSVRFETRKTKSD